MVHGLDCCWIVLVVSCGGVWCWCGCYLLLFGDCVLFGVVCCSLVSVVAYVSLCVVWCVVLLWVARCVY